MKHCSIFFFLLIFIFFSQSGFSQSRINYNNQELFLSGSNVAWINFARDIGPGTTNFTRFSQIFAEMKAAGGNSFRLWLHTTGETTPQFDTNTNLVIGPGAGALEDLQQILDLAWQNEIGLLLCLWSHDMMATSRTSILDRNEKLLTDTTAIRAYIDNALIPMVEAVKGHSAIIAWEIFNEPEGFTEIGNWGDRRHVRQFDVQRFVNLTAGAIHRADPSVQVTNGTWGLRALTDTPTSAAVSPVSFYNSLTDAQKLQIEKEFATKYGMKLSAKQVIDSFYSTAQANYNYYRDDRLIAAGGDPDGTLDFYTVHYYSWAGTALSPFHHPFSYWGLDKPLAIAEFFMENAIGVPYQNLYEQLYTTGYAGALSWQWWGDTQANDSAKNNDHSRTTATLQYMYENYPNDIVVNPKIGTIYAFKSSRDTIELGEPVTLKWITSVGSTPLLNGNPVGEADNLVVFPDTATVFTLITNNEVADTASIKVEVLFPGLIYSFKAFPPVIASGENVYVTWQTTNNSTVRLNNNPVAEDDSVAMTLTSTTTFELIATGTVTDTAVAMVTVLPKELVNRALYRNATASTGNNPQYFVDGNFDTYWTSAGGQNQWAHVNLGNDYSVDKIILKWGPDYARSFSVVNYNHPVFYQTLFQKSNATGGIDTINVNATFRNLRVILSQNPSRYSIREIEVYGEPANTTDVQDSPLIEDYTLYQNYPNPFNPLSMISYRIPTAGVVKIKVYNMLGKEVKTLVNEYKSAGNYHVSFDGSGLASGVYFYQLEVNEFVSVKRMLLLK